MIRSIKYLGLTIAFILAGLTSFSQGNCGCTNCPVAITDNGNFDANIFIQNTGPNVLGVDNCLESVCFTVSHTWIGDLDFTLTAPDGTCYIIMADDDNNSGGCGDNCDNIDVCIEVGTGNPAGTGTTGFSSLGGNGGNCVAGNFTIATGVTDPNGPCGNSTNNLDAFNNGTGTVSGVWTLNIGDNCGADVGQLTDWSLNFCDESGIDCSSSPVCLMSGINATIGACDPATGTYDITGTVTYTDPPGTGQLIIEDCNGNQQTFNPPFSGTTNFNLTGLAADGAACNLTAYFSSEPGCTIDIGGYTAPTCPCAFTLLDLTIGACDPTTGNFELSGTVEFQSPPATGQLIVEDCNGNQQTFNAPFTSPTNFSIPNIPSDGANCSLTAYFTDNATCTISSAPYTNPANCVCNADIGTFNESTTGSTNNTGPYSLCFGDELNFASNLDNTPSQDFSVGGVTYDPGFTIAVYSCPPTVFPPDDINTDPCLIGVTGTGGNSWTVTNNTGDGSTIYYVPITMYSVVDNIYAISINGGNWCWDMGPVYEVTFLPDITSNGVEDCQAGTVTVTLNGGDPAVNGTQFTASNLMPATASFGNTTAPDGGTIVINGLVDGDMYSFDVVDVNGCPHTFSGGPFVGPDDPTISPAGPFCPGDPALNLTAADPGGTWSGTGITNATNGTFDPAVAGPGTHTITYTIPGVCGGTDTEDIVVSNLLDATITPAGPFCEDAAAVILTTVDAGGTWSATCGACIDPATGEFDPATAGPGTHTITYDIPGSCGSTDTEDIVVNPLDDATITPAGPFCDTDAPVNLNAVTPGGTWSGTGITDAVNGTFDPATAGSGTWTITYTTAGACPDTDTEDIIVNNVLDPTITPAGPFCEDAAASTLIPATPGGTWSATCGACIDAATGDFDPVAAGPGTHTITYTIAGSCGGSDTEDIVVNPLDDATITPAGPFCDTDPSLNLNAATAGGTWSGTGITDPVNGTFDPANAGTGTWTITYTTAGACPDTDTEDLIVNSVLDPTINAAGPFCESNAPAILAAATPGGTWSATCGACIDAATGNFDPAAATPGTHTITYTIAGACGGSDTEDIDVIADADATIDPAGPLCTSDAAIIMTAAETGGTWTATCGACIDAATGSFDPAVAGAGTHTITYDIAGACGDTDTEDVIVTDQLDATITAVGPFCESDAIVILDAVDAGGTWTATCGTCVDAATGAFDPTQATIGVNTVTYTLGGNCGDIQTLDITVNADADATINPAGPFCEGFGTTTITAVNPGGTWSASCGACIDPATGGFNTTVAGVGTHTITYDLAGPCPDQQSIQIEVTPNDDATITQVGPFCEDAATVQLVAATAGGTWTATCGACLSTAGEFDPATAGAGTHTITYDIPGVCGNTETIDIVVNAVPVIDFEVDQASGCVPLTVTFTDNSLPAGTNCFWDFGDGSSSTDCGTTTHTYTTAGCFDVSLSITTADGCSNTATETSMVCTFDYAIADFNYGPTNTTILDPNINFTNQSQNASSYEWSFGDGTTSSANNPSHTYPNDEPGTYQVCLAAMNTEGCNDTTCLNVVINDEFLIYVPNAFTPDGDEHNNVFLPVINGAAPEEYDLYIFDRWGEIVFESHSFSNGWDGTFKGQQAKSDVYVWKIIVRDAITNEKKEFVGHVTLLR